MTQPATIRDLLDRVDRLVVTGLGQRMHVTQDTGLLRIDEKLPREILRLLDDTSVLLGDVIAAFESAEVEHAASTLSPRELADLAFLGRAELAEMRTSLQGALDAQATWQVVAKSDRAAGRAVRALLPIENALREYLELAPAERQWFDLDDTLEIRRRFVHLWRAAKRAGDPRGTDLQAAMRTIEAMIDALRHDEIYPYLRIDDRLDLRSLQKRFLAWLDADDPDDDDGPRIWQDGVAFFEILLQISRRDELREHDRLLVGRIHHELFDDRSVPEILPAKSHQELMDLAGQEPSLDVLLLPDEPARSKDYREPIARLLEHLAQRG